MSRYLSVWLASLVALMVVGIASATTRAANPFLGTWRDIDSPGDGSHLTLMISGSSTSVDVVMHDDYATVCIKAGAKHGAATITGTGTIRGSTLTYAMSQIDCAGNLTLTVSAEDGGPIAVVYDTTSDTMSEKDLTSPWARVAGATATPSFVIVPVGAPTAARRFDVSVSVDRAGQSTVPPGGLTCSARLGATALKTTVTAAPTRWTCTLLVPEGSRGKALVLSLTPRYGSATTSRVFRMTVA
jgi:hypothetical protein